MISLLRPYHRSFCGAIFPAAVVSLLMSAPLQAQVKETIHLDNGDRVSGKITLITRITVNAQRPGQTDLHDQIGKSIRITMQGQRTDKQLDRDKVALAAAPGPRARRAGAQLPQHLRPIKILRPSRITLMIRYRSFRS